jgi:hypothetical protein
MNLPFSIGWLRPLSQKAIGDWLTCVLGIHADLDRTFKRPQGEQTTCNVKGPQIYSSIGVCLREYGISDTLLFLLYT